MSDIKRERKRDIVKRKLKGLTEGDMLGAMKITLQKGYDLFKGKLKDYGTDSFTTIGAIGLFLRIKEKFGRLENLLTSGGEPNYEGIKDNIQDVMILSGVLLAMFDQQLTDVDELKKQYRAVVGEEEEGD